MSNTVGKIADNSATATRMRSAHGTNASLTFRSCMAVQSSWMRRVTTSVRCLTSSLSGSVGSNRLPAAAIWYMLVVVRLSGICWILFVYGPSRGSNILTGRLANRPSETGSFSVVSSFSSSSTPIPLFPLAGRSIRLKQINIYNTNYRNSYENRTNSCTSKSKAGSGSMRDFNLLFSMDNRCTIDLSSSISLNDSRSFFRRFSTSTYEAVEFIVGPLFTRAWIVKECKTKKKKSNRK